MRLRRKSTKIRPVGVGLTSHGPTGAVGLTTTTGKPSAATARANCSASYLDLLYFPARWRGSAGVSSVPMPWGGRPMVETVLV